MSNLTEPVEELEREAIAALEGEGFPFNPLTTYFAKYLAVCLGTPNAYKTKSIPQMLAELNSDFGGSTVSYLTSSYADLLDTLETTIVGGGGGEPEWVPDGAVVFSDFAAGNHWAGEEVVTLGDLWEENEAWSAWNPALVTEDGITNHTSDAAPTMTRAYSASILAGVNFYMRVTGLLDTENNEYELAAGELPGLSRLRQVKPGSGSYTVQDQNFSNLNEDHLPPSGFPNIACVMAVTATTVRVAMNYSDVREYTVDNVSGSAITDIMIGIVGADNSLLLTCTVYEGVPNDATMRTLSLIGAPAAPVNVSPPSITGDEFGGSRDTQGVWTSNPNIPDDGGRTYQWYRGGVAIEGETQANYSYDLPSDSGLSFVLRETVTNIIGSALADSNAIIAP